MRIVDGLKVMFRGQPERVATAVAGRARVRAANPDNPNEAHKWRKLGATTLRNLKSFDHAEMVRQSTRSAQADGLARSHMRLITSATIGAQEARPLVKCETVADRDLLQRLVDRFWDAPDNDLGEALPELMDGLTTTGSLALTVHVGKGSRATAVGYIDPEMFVAPYVLTDPENARARIAVLRAGWGRNDIIAHPILRTDDTVHDLFTGKLGQVVEIPPPYEQMSALRVIVGVPCMYLGINRVSPSQSCGISDFYPVLDLMGLLDELMFGAVQRSINIGAYSVHVKFPKGTPSSEIEERMTHIQADLESGEGRAIGTTEDVAIGAISAALQAGEWATLESTARGAVLAGMGPWPVHMFGDGANTNVATAAEQGSPIANVLLSRQGAVRRLMLRLTLYALRQYPEALAAIERNEDFELELQLPTIVAKDTTRESNTLAVEENLLLQAVDGDLLKLDAAQREFREHANRYGFDIRVEDAPTPEEIDERREMRGLPFPAFGDDAPEDEDEDEEADPEPRKVSEGTPAAEAA